MDNHQSKCALLNPILLHQDSLQIQIKTNQVEVQNEHQKYQRRLSFAFSCEQCQHPLVSAQQLNWKSSVSQLLESNSQTNAILLEQTPCVQIAPKEERVQVAKQLAKNDITFRVLNKCQNTQKDYSSDSSCPELSDDEMPNKPKINRKYLTEIDQLSEDIRQLSEDEECQHNCSSESEIQYPKDNLKSLKLVQLNYQNYQLYKLNSHVRQSKKIKCRLVQLLFEARVKLQRKTTSLVCLRQELLFLGQIRQYQDLICSDFASYINKLSQAILNLESEFQKDLLKDYMNFQQVQFLI